MARLLGHEREQNESEVTRAEDAAAAPSATKPAAPIELGAIPMALFRPAAPLTSTATPHGSAAVVKVQGVFVATLVVATMSVVKHRKLSSEPAFGY